jgi:hypothetical protein
VTEVLGLVFVAWLVYVSDAVWWIKPDRIVLYGRRKGDWREQLGPQFVLRGEGGLFVPRIVPAFRHHFELDATSPGTRRWTEREIRAAADRALRAARPLHQLGTGLWIYCFAIAPLALAIVGLRRVWPAIVAGLFAAAIAIVRVFARAWPRLHPDNPGGWKSDAWPMILSPLAAICAADTLTRSVFASVNGLAVVRALATPEGFLRIARFYYFNVDRNPALEALMARDLEDAVRTPPARSDTEMEGYCPRCHTQLARATGPCPECLDIQVVSFGAFTLSGGPSDRFQSAAQH